MLFSLKVAGRLESKHAQPAWQLPKFRPNRSKRNHRQAKSPNLLFMLSNIHLRITWTSFVWLLKERPAVKVFLWCFSPPRKGNWCHPGKLTPATLAKIWVKLACLAIWNRFFCCFYCFLASRNMRHTARPERKLHSLFRFFWTKRYIHQPEVIVRSVGYQSFRGIISENWDRTWLGNLNHLLAVPWPHAITCPRPVSER